MEMKFENSILLWESAVVSCSTDYSVTSNGPDTVAVQVGADFLGSRRQRGGTAEIASSNIAGECGTATLTVSSATPADPKYSVSEDSSSLADNLDIHLEMIRLITPDPKGQWSLRTAG